MLVNQQCSEGLSNTAKANYTEGRTGGNSIGALPRLLHTQQPMRAHSNAKQLLAPPTAWEQSLPAAVNCAAVAAAAAVAALLASRQCSRTRRSASVRELLKPGHCATRCFEAAGICCALQLQQQLAAVAHLDDAAEQPEQLLQPGAAAGR